MALSPAAQAEIQAWVEQYALRRSLLDQNSVQAVTAAYGTVDDWYNPKATIAAAILAASISDAAQDAASGLASQFAAIMTALAGGRPQGPVQAIITRLLRGRPPVDIYSRPVFAYRDAIATGHTKDEARVFAIERAGILITADIMLAGRKASVTQMEREGVLRYRRIIHPELSAGGTCGLCIAASDRIYKTEELMPMHDRCWCTVMPIIGENDPGFRLNQDDLGSLYADAAGDSDASGTSKQLLKRTRYRIEDHGELGQVLVNADHQSLNPLTKEQAQAQRAGVLLEQMRPLLANIPDDWTLEQREYQRNRVTQLESIAS